MSHRPNRRASRPENALTSSLTKRLTSILTPSTHLPRPNSFSALDEYLSTNFHAQKMSDFEAQSLSIIKSTELWDQFRQEAKERGVTTAAGLREMLKEMYVKDCRDRGISEVVTKQSDDKSVGARGRRKSWLGEAHDEDEEDVEYSPRMSFQPRQESYRQKIRGDTDGIMSLYNTDSNNVKKRGVSNARLARMGAGLSMSLTGVASLEEEEGDWRAGRRVSKSWIGGGGLHVENLLAGDTEQVDEPNNKVGTEGETGPSRSCDSYRDTANLASHEDLARNKEFQDEHNREMTSFLLNEEGGKDPNFENLTSTRSYCSDDDRSNNGQFEYPVSRKDAQERRRRRARNGDMFQSLPPNCERWIGVMDVPLNDDKGGPCGAQSNEKDVSKSMPPANVLVADWDTYDKDALIDMLFGNQQKPMSHGGTHGVRSNCSSVDKDESDMQGQVLITADADDIDWDDDKSNNDRFEFPSNRNPHSQSLPPNCQRWMGVIADSNSDDTEGGVACRVWSQKRWSKNIHQMSRSLPPKQGQGDSSIQCMSKNLKSRQHSMSTDDVSTQYTAGSELLVEWGDCKDSSDDEMTS